MTVRLATIGTFDFGDNHYFLMGIRTDAADEYKGNSRYTVE